MNEKTVDILSENPLITLKYMNERLRQELPEKPQIHIKTLANALDGPAYTLKQPRDVPAERNQADVINERYEYARWLTSLNVVNARIYQTRKNS